MGYTIDFINNQKYGADDINSIRTSVMTGGVIRKTDDGCLVTLLADGIHINKGEALFDDGCRIELTEELIMPHDGSDCYVYFNRNYYSTPALEKGDTLPENCIPLGSIIQGSVTDIRDYATMKIPSMAPNRYMEKELELDFSIGHPKQVTKTLTFEDRTDINYLLFTHKADWAHTYVLIDFITGYAFGTCGKGRINTADHYLILSNTELYIDYSKNGNTVTFNMESESGSHLGYASVIAL